MCNPAHPHPTPRERCDCGPEHAWRPFGGLEHHHYPGHSFAGGLGVRRPLRFLAWKLGLDDAQIAGLATVLDHLKTERAQAEVDDRRALSQLADAVEGEPFDAALAGSAATLRARSAERVEQKVVESLGRIHALLQPEQRARLAYLLRTGALLM